jgi:dihydroneopterin aldolase / 2-amino-4-hydroxy-6-hydroxymethyldihydropteridine diphosphokinase
MGDRVFVTNLCVHGFHGLFPEERTLGQKLYLDIDCETDLEQAAGNDDFAKTVSYASLCDIAIAVSGAGRCNLVEALGGRIANSILETFPSVSQVRVCIRKPSAPIAHAIDHVGIELTRRRREVFPASA